MMDMSDRIFTFRTYSMNNSAIKAGFQHRGALAFAAGG
jgi:hypothetical protein